MSARKTRDDNGVLSWLEKSIEFIDKYGFLKILRGLCILYLTGTVVYFTLNPETIVNIYNNTEQKNHSSLIEKRIENSPKIQKICDELLNSTKCDRVLFMELHNNTGNIAGLPFFYAKASCESISDNTAPVAEQYTDMTLSLYPFATILFNKKYWENDVNYIKDIDKSLYYKVLSNETRYISFMVVEGESGACGILSLSYKDGTEVPTNADIKSEMTKSATKIAILVEGKL